MALNAASMKSTAAMGTFVLLWGSAAIFTRWALDHSSVMAVLILRYGLALGALLLIGLSARRWLPQPGTRWRVAAIGLVLIAGYSVFYFQAMAHGITPGLLATLLGIQPILTLLLTERRFSAVRLLGLLLSLCGLTLVVWQSLLQAELSVAGLLFAAAALLCMTFGALMQKSIAQPPSQVLPLQYLVTLAAYLCLLPWQPWQVQIGTGLIIALLYLGLVISVAAQLLLYRLISGGNLVNVTSLFYLVPVVTVVLDYLVLGNTLPALAVLGMSAILAGLALVFAPGKRPH